MKFGKTIIQIYAVWGMFGAILMILTGLGLGILAQYLPSSYGDIPTIFGALGMVAFMAIGLISFYIDYNLFKFKDWARMVTTVLMAIGLIALNPVTVLIYAFILYLMWVDKDTAKLFKK